MQAINYKFLRIIYTQAIKSIKNSRIFKYTQPHDKFPISPPSHGPQAVLQRGNVEEGGRDDDDDKDDGNHGRNDDEARNDKARRRQRHLPWMLPSLAH